MEPHFDLDIYNGSVVEFVDDGKQSRPFNGPWPVLVWVKAMDALDGYGWGRNRLEQLGKIVEHYAHDVGSGDETEAVLLSVKRAADLSALLDEFEYCDEVPNPLF